MKPTRLADIPRREESARGSNQSGMRAYNERLVLSLIRQSGALAKAEIARKTVLSAQTVSVIMRALEADGLLERGEPVRGKIGQPSVPFALARDGAFFFGLKVGRRSLEIVLIDFLGNVRHRIRERHSFPTPDRTIAFVNKAIGDIRERLPAAQRTRIAGFGIALPLQLWAWAETLGSGAKEMEAWRHRDIRAELADLWDFPVFICNDASAACGAELVFGKTDKPRDFLYAFVGYFVGGGLVLDGTLHTGETGNAAALGSIQVPDGRGGMCQLVEVASLVTLERALTEANEAHSLNWTDLDDWTLPSEAREAWLDQAATGLAHAILTSVCVIDVTRVLIDGWMPESLRAELVCRVQQRVRAAEIAGIETPSVQEGTVGPDARALGAASLALSKRFMVERKTFVKNVRP